MALVLIMVFILGEIISAERGNLCPLPHLENGRIRGRRNIRFACKRDFQLVGAKFAHCTRGVWDVEMPVCVKPGCPRSYAEFVNGIFFESFRGAVVKVICDPGYQTTGTATIFCNGTKWNDTFPVCAADPKKSAKTCDFEEENICGWTQENNQNLLWTRQKSDSLPSSSPVAMTSQTDGYFMHLYVPRTRRMAYPAKLYSPVYSMPANKTACFSFWYLMSGDVKGTLKVFAKLEGSTLETSIPSFWMTGENQNVWLKGFFIIEPVARLTFQIVFDGETDKFNEGYRISIDNVKLGIGDECNEAEEAVSGKSDGITTEPSGSDTIDDFTCRNRCNESAVLKDSGDITADDLDEEPRCDCHAGCLNNILHCCNDYHQFCLFSETNHTTAATNEITAVPTVFQFENTTATNSTVTTVSPTTPKLTTSMKTNLPTVTRSFTESPALETTMRLVSKSSTLKTANKIVVTTSKPTSPPTTSAKPSTTLKQTTPLTIKTFTSTPTQSTTRLTTKRTSTERPNDILWNLADTPSKHQETVFSYYNPKSNKIPGTFQEAVKTEEKEVPTISIPLSSIMEATSAILILVLVTSSIAVFILRRRRRRLDRESLVEDSDVRFLTSDEALDFTLAKPSLT